VTVGQPQHSHHERPHLDVSDSVIWLSVVCAVPPAKPQP
jgi:hypothetical protein